MTGLKSISLKKLRNNMIFELKKKLPMQISNICIIREHNLVRKFMKKWRNHTSQRNSHLVRRAGKVILNKLNDLMKIGFYKIAY